VYEAGHIPLHKWLQATFLLTSSKKGFSAHQLHRLLSVTYKSAWFMAHRIREGMRSRKLPPLGGKGKAVEADETFIGRKEGVTPSRGTQHKRAVLSLVERGGEVRSFHIDKANAATIGPIVAANVRREPALMTDEAKYYKKIGKRSVRHEAVNHSAEEYVRGDAYTNTLEGFYSIFKRGFKGIYQHCAEKHLHRYLAEFDFRYNNRAKLGVSDGERAAKALLGIEGKRLTYRIANRAENQQAAR
jgi:transposase-like protein